MQKNEYGWYRPEKKKSIIDDYLRNENYFSDALIFHGIQILFCSIFGISCIVIGELMMLFVISCYSAVNAVIVYHAYCNNQKVQNYNFYIRTVYFVNYQHGYKGDSRLGVEMDGEEKWFKCLPRQLHDLQINTFITVVTLDCTVECPKVYVLDNVYMEYMENEEWENTQEILQ